MCPDARHIDDSPLTAALDEQGEEGPSNVIHPSDIDFPGIPPTNRVTIPNGLEPGEVPSIIDDDIQPPENTLHFLRSGLDLRVVRDVCALACC